MWIKIIHKSNMYVRPVVAAQELGISTATLRTYAKQGRIKFILTPGRQYRYDIQTCLKWGQADSDDDITDFDDTVPETSQHQKHTLNVHKEDTSK
jgi:hypothetical protein